MCSQSPPTYNDQNDHVSLSIQIAMTLRPNAMPRLTFCLVHGHSGEQLRDAGCDIHHSQKPLVIPPATLTPHSASPLERAGNWLLQLLSPPHNKAP